MNKPRRVRAFVISVLIGAAVAVVGARAETQAIRLTDALSSDEASCLSELLRAHFDYPGDHSDEISELSRHAKVGRARLSVQRNAAYVFLFQNSGWCGSAGCLLIVGERRKDNRCHLLYESDGSEQAIEVLGERDHGYRRIYTPCEARFDGRRYQQVREECPTIDVQR
jgi:hypothetical protein